MKCSHIGVVFGFGLLVGCGAQATVTMDDIDGRNADNAVFAFFGSSEGFGVDTNGNGTSDSFASIVVVLTDNSDFCRDIEDNDAALLDPEAFFGDLTLFSINASIFEDGNPDGGILQDGTVFDDNNEDTFVDSGLQIIELEETVLFNSVSDAVLTLQNVGGGSLSGSLTGTLSEFDFETGEEIVLSAVTADFSAARCETLDLLALLGGLF